MAQIKKIEIVCRPCHKCEVLKERIKTIIQALEFKYSIRIKHEFIHYEKIKEISRFGYSIKELPVLFINGEVAFIGHVQGESAIRMKLEEILKYC
jgi:hypothetical protein